MYNRYIRRDDGTYTRVSESEPGQTGENHPSSGGSPTPHSSSDTPPPRQESSRPPPFEPSFSENDSTAGFLRRLLDQLQLDRVDAGDLLLLGLLYFLFREKADEELLVALGLLLIL